MYKTYIEYASALANEVLAISLPSGRQLALPGTSTDDIPEISPVCECGSAKCGSDKHSDWCPLK